MNVKFALAVCSTLFGCLGLTLVSAADEPSNRQVTEEDLSRIPATEPADVLKTFRLARDCQLELVAAEPLVADPVDACFDEYGRMYVAEMHGYPFSQEPTKLNPSGGGQKNAGIIRLLEDTDADGRMDSSLVFADKISWPTSVCCYDGGVFVLAPQYLYYFKDTDGDNKADMREIVLSGFGRDNVQSLANNLKWGLDNKIYFAAGRNPTKLLHRGKPLFPVAGSDLRFDPRTEEFELVTGGQQFGHCLDDWGNRFVCSNSDHIQQVIYPRHYLARNPFLAVSGLVRSIAADGPSARVYRASPPEPWRIIRQKWRAAEKGYELVTNGEGGWEFVPLDPTKQQGAVPTEYPVGYFTSATGVTIYRGGAYPAEYQENAFVGDVGGNLVHRKLLKPNGVAFSAERADPNEDFIRSSDNWFRPVNFVNAPDGSLYVLDMYRETVEHPHSIPNEIKQFLHLQSGRDRGRIFRIVTPGMKRIHPPRLGDMSSGQLVAELESDNVWNRETAQRLMWQRQNRSAEGALLHLAKSSKRPTARLHALYTLAGLDLLGPQAIETSLSDPHPRVREHAVRLAEPSLRRSSGIAKRLMELCTDSDDRVRFQLAFSLGESADPMAIAALTRIARDARNGAEIRTALLSSVSEHAAQLIAKLVQEPEFVQQDHCAAVLSELSLIVGANPDAGAATRLLSSATSAELPAALQQVLLTTLGEGLSRRGSSISSLLSDEATSESIRAEVELLMGRAVRLAQDESQPESRRTEAIGLLAFVDFETAAKHLPDFFAPRTPKRLQRAAVSALAQQASDRTGQLLIEDWTTYSPQIRRDVTDAMMSSATRIHILLSAVESQTVRRSELERDKKQLLLKHPDAAIRARSLKLFGTEVATDREKVVAKYQKVLDLEANTAHGQEVFKKKCSVCHRVGDMGHQVAPELASVQNKSTRDLLIAILDPNREAQPNFNAYNVLTDNGRIYNGIIVSETANSLTLRRAEGKEDMLLRSTIEELSSTGMSLMPEGFEKDLSAQELADVIAFVKSIKPAN
jgi:putative membrane-bound dehydrogenase-like protein